MRLAQVLPLLYTLLLSNYAEAIRCDDKRLTKFRGPVIRSATTSSSNKVGITEYNVWMNLCPKNLNTDAPSPCKPESLFCYWEEFSPKVDSDHKTVIAVHEDFDFSIDDVGPNGFRLFLNHIDMSVSLSCGNEYPFRDNTDVIWDVPRYRNSLLVLESTDWCTRKEYERSSFSWFTWVILYSVLFAVIYFLASSYMNSGNSGIRAFQNGLIEKATSLATALPQFLREVTRKVFSRGAASRHGYSAV